MRILTVDDEPMILAVYRRMLRDHDIIPAPGGREALRMLEQDQAFDGIFCDLAMPDLDGVRFHDALMVLAPHLVPRVAYVTGGAYTPRMSAFIASDPGPIVEKPMSRGQVEQVLQAWQAAAARVDPPEPTEPGVLVDPPVGPE